MIHVLREVSHDNISLAVKILFLLFIKNDLLSIDSLIVHLGHASLCLLLFDEVQVSETKLLVGLFIKHNFSTLNLVASACEELVKV